MSDTDHAGCGDVLRDFWRRHDTDVVVTTARPLIDNGLVEGMTCPHGVTFWFEPTGEEIAKWLAADRGEATA